jgi:hypothetical protein
MRMILKKSGWFSMNVTGMAHGDLEKSPMERIRSQAGADAGMSLICCLPLQPKYSMMT